MEVDSSAKVKKSDVLPANQWQYDMRRDKQIILPNIYLGPYQSACKTQLQSLSDDGITHILCVCQNIEAKCVKVNFPDHFVYKVIEFSDQPCENIIQYFSPAKIFIDECLHSGGTILIHGLNGISRSAALLIAYIMETRRTTFDSAFAIVRSRRYCVAPNHGFRTQLREYEPIYQAKNMSFEWDVNSNERKVMKRNHSVMEGSEIGMDIA